MPTKKHEKKFNFEVTFEDYVYIKWSKISRISNYRVVMCFYFYFSNIVYIAESFLTINLIIDN